MSSSSSAAIARILPSIVQRKSAVSKDDQRDASIDTFLRSSLRSGQPAPGPPGPCVEPETVAAWAEGALPAHEAAIVETHVANCASCQQILAVFARTAPPQEVSPSLWQQWHLRWAVPITAAATAAAIWVAVPADRKDPIQDAFAVADSAPPSAPSLAKPRTEPAGAQAPSAARQRSEPPARRDAESSLRAQIENREVRQQKEEADRQGFARESASAAAPAAPPAAAAARSA